MKINVFWFRRDLRLEDNVGLYKAIESRYPVLPVFIFDDTILERLPQNDARVSFIHERITELDTQLKSVDSSMYVEKGTPLEVFKKMTETYQINEVYTNKDYEPQAIERDRRVVDFLQSKGIGFLSFKDHVIFEEDNVLKADGTPYTVYTPYKNKWLQTFNEESDTIDYSIDKSSFYSFHTEIPTLEEIGFEKSDIKVKPYQFNYLKDYDELRDFPSEEATSYLSPYLRFGTVSVRQMVKMALKINATFLSELIWREFFIQILYHFPHVVQKNFRAKYDGILWRNNEIEFEKWCKGETGYPMVDAGMRELNETGYMHNRVRMITAGFLCKHLLIDWRWGEAYFAEKLLDFELASNNGNWQWASGTGCDAAPYFRVFNPETQLKKFDKDLVYVRKWVKDFDELTYTKPIVEHKMARERAIETYKKGILN